MRVCLDFFKIYLFFANFVKAIDFRNYFAILFLSNLINFNNINLFRNNLEDRIDKKLL
jgi:hypothetical protein